MHGLHKNLDWLSRYLFDVSGIPFGPPIAMIDIAREPFRWTEVRQSYTKVVGVATMNQVTPRGRQRLYVWASLSGAAALDGGDDVGLTMIVGGLAYPLGSWNDINISGGFANGPLPIIGGYYQSDIFLAGYPRVTGLRPVLVGSGDTLQITHNSGVAGAIVNLRALCIDLPEYAPFPPVF